VGTENDTVYCDPTDDRDATAKHDDAMPAGSLGRDDRRDRAIDEGAEGWYGH